MRKPLKVNYVKFQLDSANPTLPDVPQPHGRERKELKSRDKAKLFPDVFSHKSQATEHGDELRVSSQVRHSKKEAVGSIDYERMQSNV